MSRPDPGRNILVFRDLVHAIQVNAPMLAQKESRHRIKAKADGAPERFFNRKYHYEISPVPINPAVNDTYPAPVPPEGLSEVR